MKSYRITLVVLVLGAVVAFIIPLDNSLTEGNALEAALVTVFFLLGVLLIRTVEWVTRGMAAFLIKVANRHAQPRWKWGNHRLLTMAGVFCLGLAFGLWGMGLVKGIDTGWSGATAAGAGIGLVTGEHLARWLFRISKEDVT